MSIHEVKRAIAELPPEEQDELAAWFEQRREVEEGPEFEPVPYERIAHLAGSLHGPGDLLSNPAHMEEYGKGARR